jgi:uncharacterized protein (TIGR00251 family)
MEHEPIRKTASGIEVDILVVPKASSATVVGVHGDRIKIRVVSPPQRNKANAAVIDLLCNATGASRAEVTRGRTGRHKTVLLTGVTIETVTRSLVSSPT